MKPWRIFSLRIEFKFYRRGNAERFSVIIFYSSICINSYIEILIFPADLQIFDADLPRNSSIFSDEEKL